jgi:hypothetical protein
VAGAILKLHREPFKAMPYSPSFRDRYLVKKENQEEAARFTASAADRLDLVYHRRVGVLGVYAQGMNSRLTFHFRTLAGGLQYLGLIHFGLGDADLRFNEIDWRASESAPDPPPTLEELMEYGLPGYALGEFKDEAEKTPGFHEIYLGIFQRLFPEVEHSDLHTDVGPYDESSSSHIKKELWRTDLLTRLQGLRFPPLEIELARSREGVVVEWQPQGHTNYQIWFPLYVGVDPKVCVYTDPTLSGSTTGWLSYRLLKNENALEKLPYTLEQWAIEDLRKKRNQPDYAAYRKVIRELLLHHIPRDLEEAWAAIRRQLIGTRHEELHTDIGAYDESLIERLGNGPLDEAFLAVGKAILKG